MNELKMRTSLIFLLFLALPAIAPASSSTALKRYDSGKYESALREYKRLLMEKPDDPRLHFNAGAAAFQANDFEEALKQLNSALVTQDLPLQERAYYNLGNTEYRLGAEARAPDKKQADWEHSIASYESALKLNPADADAKFNLELVKKKLEELQKQQQQQKQQQSKDDQKDQSQKGEKSKEDKQSKKDKQQQDKPEQQKPPSQQKDNSKPEENQAQQKPESSKEEKQSPESKKGDESKENSPENPADQEAQAGKGVLARMTPKEAQQLLDLQKADEKAMIFVPKLKTNRADRVFKDW